MASAAPASDALDGSMEIQKSIFLAPARLGRYVSIILAVVHGSKPKNCVILDAPPYRARESNGKCTAQFHVCSCPNVSWQCRDQDKIARTALIGGVGPSRSRSSAGANIQSGARVTAVISALHALDIAPAPRAISSKSLRRSRNGRGSPSASVLSIRGITPSSPKPRESKRFVGDERREAPEDAAEDASLTEEPKCGRSTSDAAGGVASTSGLLSGALVLRRLWIGVAGADASLWGSMSSGAHSGAVGPERGGDGRCRFRDCNVDTGDATCESHCAIPSAFIC